MGRHVADSPVDAPRWPRPVPAAAVETLAAEYRGLGIDPALAELVAEYDAFDQSRVSATAHRGRAVIVPEMGRFVSPRYRRAGVQS